MRHKTTCFVLAGATGKSQKSLITSRGWHCIRLSLQSDRKRGPYRASVVDPSALIRRFFKESRLNEAEFAKANKL